MDERLGHGAVGLGRGTVVRNLACPQCGGALLGVEGRRVLACPYCQTRSYLDGASILTRYRFAHISGREAARHAREFLRDKRVSRELSGGATLRDSHLVLLPFYELYARRVGVMEHSVEVPGARSEGIPVTVSDTRVLLGDLIRVLPAASGDRFGYHAIDIDALRRGSSPVELHPLDDPALVEEDEQVFAPTIPLAAIEDRLTDTSYAAEARHDTELRGARASVIYHPVWVLRISFRRGLYTIVVDGVQPRVLETRLPSDDTERVDAFLGLAMLIGVPLGKLVASSGAIARSISAAASDSLGFLLLLSSFATLALLALLAACWNRLRYPRELIVHGDESRTEMVGKSGDTPLERAVDRLATLMSEVGDALGMRRRP